MTAIYGRGEVTVESGEVTVEIGDFKNCQQVFVAPICHRLTLNRDVKHKSMTEVIAPAVVVAGHVCDGVCIGEPVDDASDGFVVGRMLVDCSNAVVPV